MEERYIGCMILHAVGDTVGYKNSKWEFKGGDYTTTLEKVYEFIDLGGITKISFKDWNVSDDTILHLQTADAMLQDYNSINTLGNIMKNNFLVAYDQFKKEGLSVRYPGKTTLQSLKLLEDGAMWNEIPYNLYSGGSGASMRTLCIGLALYGEENRQKLIQIAIESSRITNNSAVGYLGGFVSALFTAYAIEGKKINDWPFLMLELFKNGSITKYIKTIGRDINNYEEDHHVFLEKWHRYIEDKFDDNRNVVKRKATKNLVLRSKYYEDVFAFKKIEKHSDKLANVYTFIGSGGDDSVIIAYDCLIDSENNWEKLVYYAMLHNGDTDTTGAIAAGFYGAVNGYKDVPENFMEHLEYKKEIIDVAKKLYKKFYKS
ncbi:ADP-ribosylglycohydrolase [Fadolivirus algeromassiliense]|jgi:ADP-ribosylarginine hydrolase|uniref:ADP-ribosylglycohydrolase n=1 Tax=Fadolivirus FV1/VV64 TaxID=3070911 RepID=A0A7D3V8Q7_9VIRU|nr:ADP-ribosylglycohydrolase [Fadolivirus algeromassiliense]QKF93937.1 ADP-ribosylglycohydrolase [Fadolivirus FV1/VV64]